MDGVSCWGCFHGSSSFKHLMLQYLVYVLSLGSFVLWLVKSRKSCPSNGCSQVLQFMALYQINFLMMHIPLFKLIHVLLSFRQYSIPIVFTSGKSLNRGSLQ